MTLLPAWFWLLLALVPLVFLERWVHKHLQGIGLLVFRHPDVAMVVYAVLMLPGVLVHEGSHWLAAMFLGVRTGKFSVIPEHTLDGTLRLGYVETEHVDPVREALIGAAPLVAGAALIILVGYDRLGLGPVAALLGRGDLLTAGQAALALTSGADFWLWLYFIFTVSNSMLPSASDRRAWWPVLGGAVLITAVLIYAGFGTVLFDALEGPLTAALRALASAFTLTVVLDVLALPLIWLLETGIIRLTGYKVEY